MSIEHVRGFDAPEPQPHSLNCARLIPVVNGSGGSNPCTCRQLPSANSPEGRKHSVSCARINTDTGKYDASVACTCQGGPDSPKVHDHGPDEGRGLNCPEYRVKGELVGFCLLTDKQRHMLNSGVEWQQVPGRPEPVPARRASVGSPVHSDLTDASEGEVRTTSATGGHKGVKPERFDLLPPEALAQVARHYGIGAAKYGEHNWRKGHEWSKAYAALQRHAHAWNSGEDLDPETGSPHLAAVVAHALTLLTFQTEHPEFDDRFKKGTPNGSE